MKWRGRVGLTLLFLVIVVALGYGFWPKPIPAEIATASRGPMKVTVEEEGRTRLKDRFVISPPVAGVLCRIELEAGDPVEEGQVLALLEPLRSEVLDPRSRAQAQAQIAAAQASLRLARENVQAALADAEFAAAELKRLQALHQRGMITREALERAEAEARRTQAEYRSAEFAVEVARFELEAARTALGYSAAQDAGEAPERVPLKAPITGRVLKVHEENECVVNPGQPLLEIGDPRALEVEVDLLSADAVRVQPGTRVLFERWGGDEPLEGRVRVKA
jgi:HlyD family secretion protein